MYREILEQEFLKRVKSNNAYSMRAFSRDIDISSSFLTSLLKNKKNLSETKAVEVAKKLRLSTIDKKIFRLSAIAESARKDSVREQAGKELSTTLEENNLKKVMTLEEFKEVSDWVYIATLALFQTYNFDGFSHSLSKRLNIDSEKAVEVLVRLAELGYIQRKSISEPYISNTFSSSTPSDIPSEEIKKYHKNMIKKSFEAFSKPVNKREFSSLTLSCDKDLFSEAQQYLREFQLKFANKFGRSNKKNSIYQLSLQFFRIDEDT